MTVTEKIKEAVGLGHAEHTEPKSTSATLPLPIGSAQSSISDND
jgi:hypothetical protein